VKLFEQFGQAGFHACVMTSFCIDFDAFENLALHRLRGAGCNNNLVIADAGMLSHALSTSPELPQWAGRRYTLSGARSRGVFHPKIIAQFGSRSARLFVSSANLTAPGLGGNMEVAGCLASKSPGSGEAQLVASAWRYLTGFLDTSQHAIALQVRSLHRGAPWLADELPADGPVALEAGEIAAFLTPTDAQSIASQFVALASNESVDRLIVVSPYWDEDLSALAALGNALGAKEICVLVGGRSPSFPSHAAEQVRGLHLFKLGASEYRFLHAKLVIAQSKSADHVLYGSANCTLAGIGSASSAAAINAEACLYKRMRRGGALQALGLDGALSRASEIHQANMPKWTPDARLPLSEALARSPGRFELRGLSLLWWPSEAFTDGAHHIELEDRHGTRIEAAPTPAASRADGALCFGLGDMAAYPHFARAVGPDGHSARAVIVSPEILQRETRPARSREAEDIAHQLQSNERVGPWILEFIDLIMQAEGTQRASAKAGGHSGGRSAPMASEVSSTTLPYEEFIAKRATKAELRSTVYPAFGDSDLSLVRACMNRLIGAVGPSAADAGTEKDAAFAKAIALSEETELDDDPGFLGSESQDVLAQVTKTPASPAAEAAAKKKALVSSMATRGEIVALAARFRKAMEERSNAPSLTLADMLRLRAALILVLGSSCPVGKGLLDSTTQRSRVLRADGDDGWVRQLVRILSLFFIAPKVLIASLVIDGEGESVPDELVDCLATCLWTAQLLRAVAAADREMRPLAGRLETLTREIYRRGGLSAEDCMSPHVLKMFEKLSGTFALGAPAEHILTLHRASVRFTHGPQLA
jgi:hypothetical protein